jgi:hypothetical protein
MKTLSELKSLITELESTATTIGDNNNVSDMKLSLENITEISEFDSELVSNFVFLPILNNRAVERCSLTKIKALNVILRTTNPKTKLKRYMSWASKFLKTPYSFMLLSDTQKKLLSDISYLPKC